jgi:hypothetical protein
MNQFPLGFSCSINTKYKRKQDNIYLLSAPTFLSLARAVLTVVAAAVLDTEDKFA